jgi:hypothetical protein
MAVMVSDGSYVVEGTRIQALMVEGRKYGDEPGAIVIAVPYRPATATAPLDILFPELVQFSWAGEGFDLLETFFSGLDSHGPAAEFWDQHARFQRQHPAAKAS